MPERLSTTDLNKLVEGLDKLTVPEEGEIITVKKRGSIDGLDVINDLAVPKLEAFKEGET